MATKTQNHQNPQKKYNEVVTFSEIWRFSALVA